MHDHGLKTVTGPAVISPLAIVPLWTANGLNVVIEKEPPVIDVVPPGLVSSGFVVAPEHGT